MYLAPSMLWVMRSISWRRYAAGLLVAPTSEFIDDRPD